MVMYKEILAILYYVNEPFAGNKLIYSDWYSHYVNYIR